MEYKTFSKDEIKAIGFDLLERAVTLGYNDTHMIGVVLTVNEILMKFEKKAEGEQ